MKRVFLIGDSVCGGYYAPVRELLFESAQLYHPNDSARFVSYTLRYLHEWATANCDPAKIDVVHWNNGLWDVLHLLGDEAHTPLDEYRNGLKRIIRRMRAVFPNAKIIFALTTSVIEDRMQPTFYRRNAEIERYNAVARELMEEEGVLVNDLYTVSRTMPEAWHSPDGTHYTADGYRCLAEAVASAILSAE